MNRLALGLITTILFFTACGPGKPDLQSSQIRERIQKILELATVEMTFREVLFVQDPVKLEWLFGLSPWSRKALFSVNMKVQAGFDLTQGYEIKTGPGVDEVTLILPPPQVLLVDADEKSIEEYFASGGSLNFGRLQTLLSERSQEVKKTAQKLGILEKSKSQALAFAQSLFVPLGYTRISVNFRTEPAPLPPPEPKSGEVSKP